ncbi:PfkB family carbohydrate kinase [Skermanella mucosa]|uniref:carbohydrate kinase family protein n=1 Tax=Skermanella mucosa TaxID=1789672 RepID=UPI00192ACB98|nr:PfkB family carbohydrate kinase [Skermanella mucosa]UEM23860.1 PfkB family carbohydrate kinase [Skermanella mucosa]
MARIQIIARINLDVVVRLDGAVSSGAQLKGQFDQGRLGGGGSNTGVALAYAGHDVALFADVGGDALGSTMLAELSGLGIDVSSVRRLAEPTPPVLVLLDPNGERTIIRGRPSVVLPPLLPDPSELSDVLYVKAYAPEVADLLRDRMGSSLVVSHAPPAGTAAWPAHVMVDSAAHMTAEALSDPYGAARSLAGEGLRWMVVTDGSRGATAFGPSGPVHVPAEPAAVVDSTGAGDVFTAGLIHGLVGGASIRDALSIGTRWAALTVTSPTSVPPPSLRDLTGCP